MQLWHGVCGAACIAVGLGMIIRGDSIDTLARLAGALWLFASFRIGRGLGWQRVRNRAARLTPPGRRARPLRRPKLSSAFRRSALAWADPMLAGLWMCLLLFVVGYLAYRGEALLAELDNLDLVTIYSLEP